MKQTFSTKWVSSVQPRKQRKYRFNAPLHIKGGFLNVHLAKDLRTKYGTRALRVRTGDEVSVSRGQFSGRVGKVERVDTKRLRVFVAGVDQAKRDGTRRLYPLQPSNLTITKLADDKRRFPVKDGEGAPKAAKKTAAPAKAAKTTDKKDKPASARAAKA
jgi:large subunit ribosomal protein L24